MLTGSEQSSEPSISIPANETESKLADLYAAQLEIEVSELDLNQDFLDLGGDSFQATMMLIEIENTFGKLLTPAQFLENGSVKDLSKFIMSVEGVSKKDSEKVKAIQQGDNRCPIFLTHSISGYADYASSFAKSFTQSQTLYALQWVEPTDAPHTSLEDYASLFVEEIRNIAGDNPFVLAGHSFGAQFAFELGQQLLDHHLEPALIVLIDDEADLHKRRFGIRKRRPPVSKIPKQCRHMLHSYVPKTYPGNLLLVKAEVEQPDALADEFWGWKNLSLGLCESMQVPGDHSSMVSNAGIALWAQQLETKIVKVCNEHQKQKEILPDRCDTLLQKRSESWSDPVTSTLYQARKASKTGNPDSEIHHYYQALSLNKQLPFWVYRNLGEALWQKGQRSNALEYYHCAIELEQCPVEGCRLLLKRTNELGFDRADEICEIAQSRTPDQPNAQSALAILLAEAGRLESAKKVLTRTLEKAPDHRPTLLSLYELFEKSGQLEEALEILNRFVKRPYSRFSHFFTRAVIVEKLDLPDASKAFTEAIQRAESEIQIYPESFSHRLILAYLLQMNGQLNESKFQFRESIRLLRKSSIAPRILNKIAGRRYPSLPNPLNALFDLIEYLSRFSISFEFFQQTAPYFIKSLGPLRK